MSSNISARVVRWSPWKVGGRSVQSTRLYCYELPAHAFRVMDTGAGYHVSDQVVTPVAVRCIENPMQTLERLLEFKTFDPSFVDALAELGRRAAATTDA
ncbi:MAG: DUF6886 family protein [Gemmatimonas sp.]